MHCSTVLTHTALCGRRHRRVPEQGHRPKQKPVPVSRHCPARRAWPPRVYFPSLRICVLSDTPNHTTLQMGLQHRPSRKQAGIPKGHTWLLSLSVRLSRSMPFLHATCRAQYMSLRTQVNGYSVVLTPVKRDMHEPTRIYRSSVHSSPAGRRPTCPSAGE